MNSKVIPLRTYRFYGKKSRIEVDGGIARLFLPQYFGRAIWEIPIDSIGVTDLSTLEAPPALEDTNLRKTPRIPYFFTTGTVTSPNLLLLFRTPQRVPPVRAIVALAPNVDLPFGYREARSGALIDGTLLRAVDAKAAAAFLAQAGAEVIEDPTSWLIRYREIVADEAHATELRTRRRAFRRLLRVSSVLLIAGFVAGIPLRGRGDFPTWGWWVLAILLSGLVLRLVVRRGNR